MSRFSIILIVIALFSFNANAQLLRTPIKPDNNVIPHKAKHSEPKLVPITSEIFPWQSTDDWNFYFRNMEENEAGFEDVKALKESYPDKRLFDASGLKEEEATEIQAIPEIGQQYDANTFDGSYPPDNTIAVSNTGWVVAVVNSSIRYYNSAGQLKKNQAIESFINDGALNSIIFDPKIIYDSGSNRFFMCILHGFTASTSKLLLFFSKSNDPMDGWNYYKINVNADFTSRWADFPNVGVSNNEVYVTVNMFNNTGQFAEAALYQMDKNTGYNEQTLLYQVWNGIADDDGVEPFTLVPAPYGHEGNYGPGIVLVSTRGAASGTKLQVFDLTNDINNSPELNGYHTSIPGYEIGGNAVQPDNGDDLDVGDCRMKSAFFLDNRVHCVFTSSINSQGWNGINYSRIDLGSLTATNSMYGFAGRDIVYPAVASFTLEPWNNTVIIGYEESGPGIYPSFRAVVCDHSMNWGSAINILTGDSKIDVETDNTTYERWGDYLGISRKPGTQYPTVWLFGIYGKSTSSYGVYGNNVVEITNAAENAIGDEPEQPNESSVYPNPAEKYFNIHIETDEAADARFELYDATGKLVKHLATKSLTPGEFEFGFSSSSLPAGLYFLKVITPNKILANEKIVVQ